MTAYNLLEKTQIFERLNTLFPEFVETSKQVTVIPWEESFQVTDKNPEVIDTIEFYEELLKNSLITEEQFQNFVNQAIANTEGPISRTEGIAFITTREVSFRSFRPSPDIIIHEVGHIHYKEQDPIWSATYAGGESLVHLALYRGYNTDDATVRAFHQTLHRAAIQPNEEAKRLAEVIVSKTGIKCYPHLYALELFGGTIAEDLNRQLIEKNLSHIYMDLTNPAWKEIEVSYSGVRMFFANVFSGLRWKDPFSVTYGKALGLVK